MSWKITDSIFGGRPVAALVYQRRKHLINVSLGRTALHPASLRAPLKARARQGYNVYRGSKPGMVCWAVSDLNAKELMDFARLLRNAT